MILLFSSDFHSFLVSPLFWVLTLLFLINFDGISQTNHGNRRFTRIPSQNHARKPQNHIREMFVKFFQNSPESKQILNITKLKTLKIWFLKHVQNYQAGLFCFLFSLAGISCIFVYIFKKLKGKPVIVTGSPCNVSKPFKFWRIFL